jgi:Tol biopolymer transport system component
VLLAVASARAQETVRVSVDSSGAEADNDSYGYVSVLSADGRFVVFSSIATNLVPNDMNGFCDLFVHDRSTGTTQRVSVDSNGAEGNADAQAWEFTISADGSSVAFVSVASNFVPNDTNQNEDIFVHDLATGTTERANVDSNGGQAAGGALYPGSRMPALSADGRVVAFSSYASNLVPGDTNGKFDDFVHDRTTGATERISVDSSGAQADDHSGETALSADGRFVAFTSLATNLVPGDTNGHLDVFVRDRSNGTTERVSVDSNALEADRDCFTPTLSSDARYVAFASDATNLVPGDNNQDWDVFVRDRATGTTERVSVDSSGAEANGTSWYASISGDGMRVAFESSATNLVPGDTNGCNDVFVHDRTTGATERMSVASDGSEDDCGAFIGSISGNGRVVAFCSCATNLVASDGNGLVDVFVRHDCGAAQSSNYGTGLAGTFGVPSLASDLPVLGATLNVYCENSLRAPTVGILFLGFQRAQLHTHFGGDLLLLPALCVPITFSFGLDTFTGSLPDDDLLCGEVVDLQVVEADAGAVKGVSFTQGLEIVLGR